MDHKYIIVFVLDSLSNPQKAVQASHACLLRSTEGNQDLSTHHLILFSVKSIEDLERYLEYHSIKYSVFVEPDLNYTKTAICTEAIPKSKKKLFKSFNLYQ